MSKFSFLNWKREAFTTVEIVLMAMLATANAVMTFYLSFINKILNSAGGPIATATIVGLYMIYGLLAYYIIRKPGTAIITYGIGGTIQCFIGTSYGITAAIVAALCYMVVAEVMFALFRYKRWGISALMFVGGAMVPIWFLCAAYMFGYTAWGWEVLTIALVVRVLSGMLLCGLMTKLLGDSLERTGLLRRYKIKKEETSYVTGSH
ncbi:ECF transporter S component [Paenibacillus macquariensis]|uniref:Energy-coupling factor transport system substrate-specific component n=1 Tax=Paenibacillus macquariensis TaxID=948756 RepID=A0ABY1K8R5_9BACL|nr:ECF transporter S component [Paenibacillus macquariensis]SIR41554.1 energy-coupling factor transport system substrate-specific component [Paenibacillus macquariensis]